MALDFACTSGMRADRLREACENPSGVASAYAQFKRDFAPPGETETTEQLCKAEGFRFVPMVVEAHGGGWSPLTRSTIDSISRTQASCIHEDFASVSLKVAQRISRTLHKENARAILRRAARPLSPSFLYYNE